MNDISDSLLPFIPEQYRHKVMLALMLSPYATRAYHALRNGGGIRGVACSIWFGTNVPKEVSETVKLQKP